MNDQTPTKNRSRFRLVVATLALLGLLAPAARTVASPQSRGEAAKVARKVERAKSRAAHEAKEELEAVRHFQKRLDRYVRVHENQLARLGGQNAVIAQGLADAIIANRAGAKQGDVFLREIRPLLMKLIAEQLKGPDTRSAQEAIKEGNPDEEVSDSVPVVPRVNGVYPAGASRSTVPTSLLLTLPKLPECLHYRFVGRDLLLVDTLAQVIVDILPNAAPVPGRK